MNGKKEENTHTLASYEENSPVNSSSALHEVDIQKVSLRILTFRGVLRAECALER